MKWIKSHPWWTGVLTVLLAIIIFFFYTDLHLLLRSRPADMDAAITQEMQSGKVPGAAMLIIRDGKIESAKGYGVADPETGRVVTPDTLFTIASISKTMTATALMTLYEQGKFELDDDVNKYLPFEVRNPNFPDKPITFRMLLTHTSSIKDSDVYNEYYTLQQEPVLPDSPVALGDYLRDYLTPDGKLYNVKDNFLEDAPGTKYEYSNTGFGLVGYLVERISGMPFSEYCKQAVFEPLGMEHTAWYFKDVDIDLMAVPYGYNELLRQPKRYGFYSYPTYPDGALKTSVNEFARFMFVFINEGKTIDGKVFLQPETVKEMLTLHKFPGMSDGESVGLAWHFDGSDYNHSGGDPGISTLAYFNPDTGMGGIFFSNGGDMDLANIPGLARGFYFYGQMMSVLKENMNVP
ncbi:MAG TPA: serine hydrolase domain-containing protein [Anaerolineales bacterium]|nr:serine hydrolase domain-containing protein [Anaerolineales bacterium]